MREPPNGASADDEDPPSEVTDGFVVDAAPTGDDVFRHLGWARLRERYRARLISPLARAETLAEVADVTPGAQRMSGELRCVGLEQARFRLAELDGLEWLIRADASAGEPGSQAAELARRLEYLEDLGPSMSVAGGGGSLSVVELMGLRDALAAARAAAALLRRSEAADGPALAGTGALRERMARLKPVPDLLGRLERAIETDEMAREPRLADRASPELAAARKQVAEHRRRLTRRAESLVRRSEYATALQDTFWTERDGRVVLPFRSGGLGKVRGGIIHASSGSGQTTYVEPAELVEANNAVREAELRVAVEERRILAELSRAAGECSEQVVANQAALVELDRIRARLLLSQAMDGKAPRLEDPAAAGDLMLPGARHPLMVLDGVDVVPNDLTLRRGSALIITGPNAGGKTVSLKTVGICVLMAAAGLRLPTAAPASVPLFRHVVTDVGDDQSIAANLSTFSAHVQHLCRALANAEVDGAGTLVLLDEIAVGTDPEQGAALAESILRHLVERGATVVVTTHYERLKLLATQDDAGGSFANAAVGFDVENMRPTFRVTLGVPGASSALAVARRLGLPSAVLDHAQTLLSDEGLHVDVLLREIEAERVRLADASDALEEERARLSRLREEVERRERRALEKAKSRKAKAYEAASEQLRALETELKHKRKELRRHGESNLPERADYVGGAREQLVAHSDQGAANPTPPSIELALGQRVRVHSLGEVGEVVAIKGDRLTVQLPRLKTSVARSDVQAEEAVERPSTRRSAAEPIYSFRSDAARHFGADAKPVDAGIDDVVDVRGVRVEDLFDQLERELSDAIIRDREVLMIRHGHGSGQLRKAVREHLRRLPYVKRHRGGLPPEGGDAVTVVWIEP